MLKTVGIASAKIRLIITVDVLLIYLIDESAEKKLLHSKKENGIFLQISYYEILQWSAFRASHHLLLSQNQFIHR